MKKTAILLTTYNRINKTIDCLLSIKNCLSFDSTKFDIYLADSNSSDGTLEAIRALNMDIKAFNVGDNIFWNKGMIMAWKKAVSNFNYDFYILINDDTILHKDAFNILFDDYNKCLKNSIIVGVTSQGELLTYGGRKNSLKDQILKPNGKPQKVKYMNGNIVLIPKIVYEKLGFLNLKYTHLIGDIDYGLRALKNGFNLFIASKVIGNCEGNDFIWYNPKKSFIQRFKLMLSPKGVPFNEFLYFNYIHFGVISSLKFIFASLFALTLPKSYIKYKKK